MQARWLILDRDGVVNQDSAEYVKSVDEWIPISGSLAAIAQLCQAGFTVTIATNQSGIGRGYYTEQVLAAMHQKMNRLLEPLGGHIAHIAYCPHLPDAGCACRKPLPGLLYQLEQQTGLSLQQAVMVGDSLRDLQAAQAAGVMPVLVLTGNGDKTRQKAEFDTSIAVFDDLAAVAQSLLA